MIKIYITVFIIIEKPVKFWWCGIYPRVCQTNMFYYNWRTSFVHQSTSTALQNVIITLFCDIVLVIWILHFIILQFQLFCNQLYSCISDCEELIWRGSGETPNKAIKWSVLNWVLKSQSRKKDKACFKCSLHSQPGQSWCASCIH